MSKELEALNYVWYHYYTKELDQDEVDEIEKNLNVVQDGLKRLESIDNAEPSEALNCLERLHDCGIFNYEEMEDYNAIKKALLKAQTPKHYLKWEDLEFKEEGQIIKVILNGSKYKIAYFTDGITEHVELATCGEKLRIIGIYVDANSYDKQFFNDLHLERVEE